MPFAIRSYRLVPVCCPVMYYVGDFEGHGMVFWNCSHTGWRFSGNLPLRVGEVCSLTVTLPPYQPVYLVSAIVRRVRGKEYGVDTLMIDDKSCDELTEFIEKLPGTS